ncbi:MAG: helix-turn-helix transcriptional regulator [Bacteroidia bacterium]
MHLRNMYICRMHSSELVKGTLKTIILNLLSNNGKMYGYEITQSIQDITKGEINITEGSLYPALHGMVAEKLLTTESVVVDNRVRKYYKLTKEGKVETKKKLNEFSEFIMIMHGLLNLKPVK